MIDASMRISHMELHRDIGKGGGVSAGRAAIVAAGAAIVCLLLAACNTTEGVGKDIESAGEGIKEAAQDAKD
jgi:predicted small secreted protein